MPKTFRDLAKEAKLRMKNDFWKDAKKNLQENLDHAREQGINERRAERYFTEQISQSVQGRNQEDEFYLKVKELLLTEGEVSDAIGRLTDREYYETLSYEERQRYSLSIADKYLRALERFRREYEFEAVKNN